MRPNAPKTIFITSFHGLVSRVLESGCVERLVAKRIRVVLLVPAFKVDYFSEVFGKYANVIVEGINTEGLPRRAHFFHELSFMLLHTKTMRLIRRSHRGYGAQYKVFLADALAATVGQWRWGRSFFRVLNARFLGKPLFDAYFAKYEPSLIFSTDSKHLLDTALLIEAKGRGVRTVSMVRSWDYLTAKGIVRVQPDRMMVHNEIIKQETMEYVDMDREDIVVIGIPHFDPYVNEPRSSKAAFRKRVGIPLDKRMVLYAPIGAKFGDADGEILSILAKGIDRGILPKNLAILVRLPPGDTIELKGFTSHPAIVFDEPGKKFDRRHRKSNEMTYDDVKHLADSMYWSDVVLTGPSTMAIDAAAFNKPIIFIGFDGYTNRPYYESVQHYYDFLHMQNVMRTDGARFARSPEELVVNMNRYLQDPSLEENERKRIVQEQCGILDGRASMRLAEELLSQIS